MSYSTTDDRSFADRWLRHLRVCTDCNCRRHHHRRTWRTHNHSLELCNLQCCNRRSRYQNLIPTKLSVLQHDMIPGYEKRNFRFVVDQSLQCHAHQGNRSREGKGGANGKIPSIVESDELLIGMSVRRIRRRNSE